MNISKCISTLLKKGYKVKGNYFILDGDVFYFKKYLPSDLAEPVTKILNKDTLTKSDELFQNIASLAIQKDLYYMFYRNNKFVAGSQITFEDDDKIYFQFKFLKDTEKKVIKKCIETMIADLKKIYPGDKIRLKTGENFYKKMFPEFFIAREGVYGEGFIWHFQF